MDHILYQIFKIALNIFWENMEKKTGNPSVRIYVTKIENIITFRIKTGYYLELLTLEATKNKITWKKPVTM